MVRPCLCPWVHDLDRPLDVAERLVAEAGPDGVTIRGLATEIDDAFRRSVF